MLWNVNNTMKCQIDHFMWQCKLQYIIKCQNDNFMNCTQHNEMQKWSFYEKVNETLNCQNSQFMKNNHEMSKWSYICLWKQNITREHVPRPLCGWCTLHTYSTKFSEAQLCYRNTINTLWHAVSLPVEGTQCCFNWSVSVVMWWLLALLSCVLLRMMAPPVTSV